MLEHFGAINVTRNTKRIDDRSHGIAIHLNTHEESEKNIGKLKYYGQRYRDWNAALGLFFTRGAYAVLFFTRGAYEVLFLRGVFFC